MILWAAVDEPACSGGLKSEGDGLLFKALAGRVQPSIIGRHADRSQRSR